MSIKMSIKMSLKCLSKCVFEQIVFLKSADSCSRALHLWTRSSEDHWEPGVTSGGHHGPVEDLDWERNGRLA
jgi:hypothetical protein